MLTPAAMAEFIQEAKAKAKAEYLKSTAGIRGYAETFLTSRISLALSAIFFIAFASTALYFPGRLPPIAAPGLINAGLLQPPPTLDLSTFNVSDSDVREKTNEAVAEAKPYLQEKWEGAVGTIPHFSLYVNLGGAALSLAMFLYTLKLQVRAARMRDPEKSLAL